MLAAGCKGEKVAARSGLFFSLRTLRICFVFAPPPSLCCASLCPSFLLGSHLGGQEPTAIYAGVRGEAGRSLQPHGNGRGGPPFIFSCLRPRPRPHPSRLAFCMQVPATATRPPPGRHTTLRSHLHVCLLPFWWAVARGRVFFNPVHLPRRPQGEGEKGGSRSGPLVPLSHHLLGWPVDLIHGPAPSTRRL